MARVICFFWSVPSKAKSLLLYFFLFGSYLMASSCHYMHACLRWNACANGIMSKVYFDQLDERPSRSSIWSSRLYFSFLIEYRWASAGRSNTFFQRTKNDDEDFCIFTLWWFHRSSFIFFHVSSYCCFCRYTALHHSFLINWNPSHTNKSWYTLKSRYREAVRTIMLKA